MSDFEDSQSPTWNATIQGQLNLRDAIQRTIHYESPEGKAYRLDAKPAVLIVRPRGWHLLERHVLVDGKPVSASIFDFALYFFHNAKRLIANGSGPYFYLPKMESHLEARLWNSIFNFSEDRLGLPHGTVRATVLIETILAGFEMDEILYELRTHSAGLNCGRWDYIFSFIKKFREKKAMVLPDRSSVTMDKAFLAAYVKLSVKTCHRRGAHSIGGMSAYIPVKNEEANRLAMEKVTADKERELKAGHDGTWVAHPGLVPLAKEIFSKMNGSHQMHNLREDVVVSQSDLLSIPTGEATEKGVRTNISVGIQYLEAWLKGKGSVPIDNLMEDAATAEICRAQLWQWIRHGTKLSGGKTVTRELFRALLDEEVDSIRTRIGQEAFQASQFKRSISLFDDVVTADEFQDFLTLSAYEELLSLESPS
jgi:malate synthase